MSIRPLRGLIAAIVGCLLLIGCAGAPPAPPIEAASVTVHVSADRMAFDQSHLAVPADVPFAIDFENQEAVPHNVAIRGGSVSITTEIFSGPDARTYVFEALPAGTYTFLCELHPEMRGVLEVTLGGEG
ncbi:hypothetical protein BH23CHL7_BH23CHL7_19650 [soil metagenome]